MLASLLLAGAASLYPPQLAGCGLDRLLPNASSIPITATVREADGRWLIRTESWREGEAIGAPVHVTRWTFLVDAKTCAVTGLALSGEWPAIGRSGYPRGEPATGFHGRFVRSKNVKAVDEQTRATLLALADASPASTDRAEHHEALASRPLPAPPAREKSKLHAPLFSAPRDPIAFTSGPPATVRASVSAECAKEPVLPIPGELDGCHHVFVAGGTALRDVVRREGWAIVQSDQGGFALVAGDRSAWLGRTDRLTFRAETGGIAWLEATRARFGDTVALIAVDVRSGTLWSVSVDDALGEIDASGVPSGTARVPWADLRRKLPE